MLVVSQARRRAKLQCPKCREVIALPAIEAEVVVEPKPEPRPAPVIEMERSSLEERVAALEREVAALRALLAPRLEPSPEPVVIAPALPVVPAPPVAPPLPVAAVVPEPIVPPAPPVKASFLDGPPAFMSLARPAPAPVSKPEPVPVPRAEPPRPPREDAPFQQMVRILGEMRGGSIEIRSEVRDSGAVQYGRWLATVFSAAGWKVESVNAQPLPEDQNQFSVVTAGNFPVPRLLGGMLRAFAAVGVSLMMGIDPARTSPSPLLIVPVRPEEP
jgi:hypothetical protein